MRKRKSTMVVTRVANKPKIPADVLAQVGAWREGNCLLCREPVMVVIATEEKIDLAHFEKPNFLCSDCLNNPSMKEFFVEVLKRENAEIRIYNHDKTAEGN